MNTYKIIPEYIIRESDLVAKSVGQIDNNFQIVLEAVEKYKEAGMTPVILLDPDKMDMIVVAKETYNKQLH
jgi:hypothetical protein